MALTLTLQACDRGCLKCTSGNECVICDVTNNFYLQGTTCQTSNITNCAVLSLNGDCLQCGTNTYLDVGARRCVGIDSNRTVANCQTYAAAQLCSSCSTNFYVNNGQCVAVTNLVANCDTYLRDGVCTRCAQGYMFNMNRDACIAAPTISGCGAYSFLDCQRCREGYIQNPNIYFTNYNTNTTIILSELQRLRNGLSPDWTPLARCQRILITNCLVAQSANICSVCNARYFLTQNGTCQAYPLPVIEGCLVYSSPIVCITCTNGFYLEAPNRCSLIPTTSLIANCTSYDPSANSVQCAECIPSKILTSNVCTTDRVDSLNIQNCQRTTVDADTCAVCVENNKLTDDGKKCLPAISNCSVYSASSISSTAHTCSECSGGFYLNVIDSTTSCTPGTLTGCNTYSTATTCTACSNNYFLQNAQCIAQAAIPNCLTTDPINQNQCSVCSPGFFPLVFAATCQTIPTIPNCISYDPDSGNCLVCGTGFYLQAPRACASFLANNPNCQTWSIENNRCSACKNGFVLQPTTGACSTIYDYVSANCAVQNNGVSFTPGNVAVNGCSVCADNAEPVQVGGAFFCLNTPYATYRGATILTDCLRYTNDAVPKCAECAGDLVIADIAATPTTCAPAPCAAGRVLVLDNLDGFVKACVTVDIPNCRRAVRIAVGNNDPASFACIEVFGTDVIPVVTNVGEDIATIAHANRETLPKPAKFFYRGYKITGTPVAAANNVETAKDRCELYYLISEGRYGCYRCQLGYTVTIPADSSTTTCTALTECNTNTKYTGFHSYVNAVLSCHVCTNDAANNPRFPTLHITQAGDAASAWSVLTPNTRSVTCQVAPAADAGLVANCAVYALLTNNANTLIACVACKPGFFATAANVNTKAISSCTAINNCDTTQTQTVANRCSTCIQRTAGTPQPLAFSNAELNQCVATSTTNCFITSAIVIGNNQFVCSVCKTGYFLNIDFQCEKLYIPRCSDTSSTNFGAVDNNNLQIYNLLRYTGFINGCGTCVAGFTSFKLAPSEIQCLKSDYVTSNASVATNHFIRDCLRYQNSIGAGETGNLRCAACRSPKIPTLDITFCANSIANCAYAQNADRTKCAICVATHINVNGICQVRTITNCATYQNTITGTDQLCLTCNPGFVLSGDNKICTTGAIIGCATYTEGELQSCSACLPNYTLVNTANNRNYCLRVNTESGCTALEPGTTGLQGGFYRCTNCASTNTAAYVLRPYTALPNQLQIPQSVCLPLNTVDRCLRYGTSETSVAENTFLCTVCEPSYYLNEARNACIARTNISAGCQVYSFNSDVCITCNNSSFLNADRTACQSFPTGIIGCDTYSNSTVCTQCLPPRYLANNTCLLSTLINRCARYSGNNTCTSCEIGYFLTNSTFCELARAANCFTYASINACASCDPANNIIGLQTDTNGVTSCVDKNLLNCIESTNQSPFRCTLCRTGFYPNPDGICTTANTIARCVAYDGSDTCSRCEENYVLVIDRRACNNTLAAGYNDVNCIATAAVANATCSRCAPGSYFVNNICTSCANNTFDSGCFNCDPNNQSTCFACRPGYYQNQNGTCITLTGQTNNTVTTTNATGNSVTLMMISSLASCLAFMLLE